MAYLEVANMAIQDSTESSTSRVQTDESEHESHVTNRKGELSTRMGKLTFYATVNLPLDGAREMKPGAQELA